MTHNTESPIAHHFVFPSKDDPCSIKSCEKKICGALCMPVQDRVRNNESILIVPLCTDHSFSDLNSDDLEKLLFIMALENDSRTP